MQVKRVTAIASLLISIVWWTFTLKFLQANNFLVLFILINFERISSCIFNKIWLKFEISYVVRVVCENMQHLKHGKHFYNVSVASLHSKQTFLDVLISICFYKYWINDRNINDIIGLIIRMSLTRDFSLFVHRHKVKTSTLLSLQYVLRSMLCFCYYQCRTYVVYYHQNG